ncbi:MAG TPA: amino acid racemase [Pyrinomonadaceae bacterium]|nr:amino acid racemase [Pyrinomonadaceae bacterium]
MKTVGIIGGIGPESTIEYYRGIIAGYRERQTDGSYPSIILNSINLRVLLGLITANELDQATDHLVDELQKLARAGVDFGVIAAGTPHIVFDQVRERSPLPLISIVEATCDAAAKMNLKKIALFGTRFTMQGRFYKDVFSKAGIKLVVPEADEQAYIHDKYMNDLVHGIVLPETRERLLRILDQMKERDGVEALILGGTELSLIIKDAEHNGLPILDTTRIHVARIVAELLS